MKRRTRTAQQGFTMVVIAGLFAAFSVIAAIAIDRGSVTKQLDQQAAARAQLGRLSNAIIRYYTLNSSKYPCPARYDLATNVANYGLQWSSGSDCTSGTSTGIDVLLLTNGSTSNDIRGMVPITALTFYGADLSDAVDPWGNRIMYVVNRQLTASGSGTATTCASTTSCIVATDRPNVVEGITSTTVNPADFVLISYGPDKLGAIPKSGTSVTIPCAATTDIRGENCDTDILFANRPVFTAPNTTVTGTYIRYDDLISFYAAQ